jgi:hypothetical protein
MPIKLPNLDDRTFADLVAEAHTLIPVHAPQWTNHNESDPGITLVELFAYLTEMQIYRLNRVTDANVCAFLRLMDGVERIPSKRNRGMVIRPPETTEVALRDEVRDVVLQLRKQDRAITCEDFELLAREADAKVSRAYCIPQRNLTASSSNAIPAAHVSVVVVPTEVLFDAVSWSILSNERETFSDVTAASAGNGQTISLWSTSGQKSQWLYLGSSTVFESFNLTLAETGVGYVLTYEYFDGKNWTRLKNDKHQLSDGTSNWTTSGLVTFTRPTDWRTRELNHLNGYWLRISSITVPTKTAVASRIHRNLLERVRQYLEPRRLLTTRIQVAGPRLVTIGVHVSLRLKPDAVPETVKKEAENRLKQFLNFEVWPFGRNVYISEIYHLLDRVPGVDFVADVVEEGVKLEIITAHDLKDDRAIREGEALVAIRLNPDELVQFSPEKSNIVPNLVPRRDGEV